MSQNENNDFDSYRSVVVIANTEEEARFMHPDNIDNIENFDWINCNWNWCKSPNQVNIEYLGEASASQSKRFICISSTTIIDK